MSTAQGHVFGLNLSQEGSIHMPESQSLWRYGHFKN